MPENWSTYPPRRYAERPGYAAPRGARGRLGHDGGGRPRPLGSGWPYPLYDGPPRDGHEDSRRRALIDRALARHVVDDLYGALGPMTDCIAVYADDAVITLEGVVSHADAACLAEDVACARPGVRDVENALCVERW